MGFACVVMAGRYRGNGWWWREGVGWRHTVGGWRYTPWRERTSKSRLHDGLFVFWCMGLFIGAG